MSMELVNKIKKKPPQLVWKSECMNSKIDIVEVIRCKDCKWYDERISICDNCGLPREQMFFCADGKRGRKMMINREQLIKALEYCTADECNPDCPYYEVDVGCRTRIEIDALTLLKEQEVKPVKVVKTESDYELYYCPRCDRPFCDFYYVKPKFCDKCGQAVKWNA